MTRILRMSEAEFRKRQAKAALTGLQREGITVQLAKRQAATYALKPDYARELAVQVRDAGLPVPVLEYAFDKQLDGGGRGWKFDLCWPRPDWMLACEVDGAVHRIKSRFKGDLAKHQAAVKLGYRVLRVSPAQVRDGSGLEFVRGVLAGLVVG